VDSEELAAPVDLEIVNRNRVGADSEIVNEKASIGDAWILQRSQPLFTQKKSTKMESVSTGKSSKKQLPKVTRGFVTVPIPFKLRNC
jgi:hypothetical protein